MCHNLYTSYINSERLSTPTSSDQIFESSHMPPFSLPSDSRPSMPSFLFQPPRRWTSEHFQMLKLSQQQSHHPAEEIVGALYLPSDGDEGVFFSVLQLRITSMGASSSIIKQNSKILLRSLPSQQNKIWRIRDGMLPYES